MALLAYGTATNDALKAADMLARSGVSATVVDMRCGARGAPCKACHHAHSTLVSAFSLLGRCLVRQCVLTSKDVSMEAYCNVWPSSERQGSWVSNLHCRFCKPLDGALVRRLAREHPVLITIEEGAIGGFGSHGARSSKMPSACMAASSHPFSLRLACFCCHLWIWKTKKCNH